VANERRLAHDVEGKTVGWGNTIGGAGGWVTPDGAKKGIDKKGIKTIKWLESMGGVWER